MLAVTLRRKLVVEVILDGKEVRLPRCEAALLERLAMARPGKFLSRGKLVEAIYPNTDEEPNQAEALVARFACRLRQRGIPVEGRCGWGYRLLTR